MLIFSHFLFWQLFVSLRPFLLYSLCVLCHSKRHFLLYVFLLFAAQSWFLSVSEDYTNNDQATSRACNGAN